MFGTTSSPNGVSTFSRTDVTSHVPRNSSGKKRSDGPPPMASHALSAKPGSFDAGAVLGKTAEAIVANKAEEAARQAVRRETNSGGGPCRPLVLTALSASRREHGPSTCCAATIREHLRGGATFEVRQHGTGGRWPAVAGTGRLQASVWPRAAPPHPRPSACLMFKRCSRWVARRLQLHRCLSLPM